VQVREGFKQAISIKLKLLNCNLFPQHLSRKGTPRRFRFRVLHQLKATCSEEIGDLTRDAHREEMMRNVMFKFVFTAFQSVVNPKMDHFQSTLTIPQYVNPITVKIEESPLISERWIIMHTQEIRI